MKQMCKEHSVKSLDKAPFIIALFPQVSLSSLSFLTHQRVVNSTSGSNVNLTSKSPKARIDGLMQSLELCSSKAIITIKSVTKIECT